MRFRNAFPLSLLITLITIAAVALPPFQWSQPTGFAVDATVATNGDLFLVGDISGTVDFGDTLVTAAGSRDVSVSRYDEGGNTLWVRHAGKSGAVTHSNHGNGVVATSDGGCIIGGTFTQEMTFDSTHVIATTGGDMFVARYDSDGNVQWVTPYGTTSSPTVVGAAADGADGCYLLAWNSSWGAPSVRLVRYDNTGAFLWELGGENMIPNAVGSDAAGNALMVGFGSFGDPVMLGDSTLAPDFRNFMAKVSPAGDVVWLRSYVTQVIDNEVITDAGGAIYVCGSFQGSAVFDDTTLTANTIFSDGFIARFDPDGNFEWAREVDAESFSQEAELINMAITPGGNVVAAARFVNKAIVEGDTLSAGAGGSGLVLEWSSSGVLLDYFTSGRANLSAMVSHPIEVNANNTLYRYEYQASTTDSHVNGYYDVVSGIRTPIARANAELLPNYPNPFNPATTVSFLLHNEANAELVIFDVTGNRVHTLASEAFSSGTHQRTWNGDDDFGNSVASGVYFVRLRAGTSIATRKMVLLK